MTDEHVQRVADQLHAAGNRGVGFTRLGDGRAIGAEQHLGEHGLARRVALDAVENGIRAAQIGGVGQRQAVHDAALSIHGGVLHGQRDHVGGIAGVGVAIGHHELLTGGRQARLFDTQRIQCRGQVQQPGAVADVDRVAAELRVGFVVVADLARGTLQDGLDFWRRQIGPRLQQQADGAGDVRCGHRGARNRAVPGLPLRLQRIPAQHVAGVALDAGRGVGHAGRGDVGVGIQLSGLAPRRPGGQRSVALAAVQVVVHGHADHAGRGVLALAGCHVLAAVAAVIAGSKGHDDLAFDHNLLDQARSDRTGVVGRARGDVAVGVVHRAQRRVVGIQVGEQMGVRRGRTEHHQAQAVAPVHQLRLRRHAGEGALDIGRNFGDRIAAVGLQALTGDDARHVGAVAATGGFRTGRTHVHILGEAGAHEVGADNPVVGQDVAEIRVQTLQPAVDDAQGHATAVQYVTGGIEVRPAGDRLLRHARTGRPAGRLAEIAQRAIVLDAGYGGVACQRLEGRHRPEHVDRAGVVAEVLLQRQSVGQEQLVLVRGAAEVEVHEGPVAGRRTQRREIVQHARVDGRRAFVGLVLDRAGIACRVAAARALRQRHHQFGGAARGRERHHHDACGRRDVGNAGDGDLAG